MSFTLADPSENQKLLERAISKATNDTEMNTKEYNMLQNKYLDLKTIKRSLNNSHINVAEEINTVYSNIESKLGIKIKHSPHFYLNNVLSDIRILSIDENSVLRERILINFTSQLYVNLLRVTDHCTAWVKPFRDKNGTLVIERFDSAANRVVKEEIKNFDIYYLKLFMFFSIILTVQNLKFEYDETMYPSIGLEENTIEYASTKYTDFCRQFLNGPVERSDSYFNPRKYYQDLVVPTDFKEDTITVIFLNAFYSAIGGIQSIYTALVKRKNSYMKLLNKTKEYIICMNSQVNCEVKYDGYNNLEFIFNSLNISANRLEPINVAPIGFNIISTNGLQNILSNYEKITLKSFKISKQSFITPLENKNLYLVLTGVRTELNYYNNLVDNTMFIWYGTFVEKDNFYEFIPNANINFLTYSNININVSYIGFYITDNPGKTNRIKSKISVFSVNNLNIFNITCSLTQDIQRLNNSIIKKINFFHLDNDSIPIPLVFESSMLESFNPQSLITKLLLDSWPSETERILYAKYNLHLITNSNSRLLRYLNIVPYINSTKITLNVNNWSQSLLMKRLVDTNISQSSNPTPVTLDMEKNVTEISERSFITQNPNIINQAAERLVYGMFTPISVIPSTHAGYFIVEGIFESDVLEPKSTVASTNPITSSVTLRGETNVQPRVNDKINCDVNIGHKFIKFNGLFDKRSLTCMITSLKKISINTVYNISYVSDLDNFKYLLDVDNEVILHSPHMIPSIARLNIVITKEIAHAQYEVKSRLINPFVYLCNLDWTIPESQDVSFMHIVDGDMTFGDKIGVYQEYYSLMIKREFSPAVSFIIEGNEKIEISDFIETTDFLINGPNTIHLLKTDLSIAEIETNNVNVSVIVNSEILNTPLNGKPRTNKVTMTITQNSNNKFLASKIENFGTDKPLSSTINTNQFIYNVSKIIDYPVIGSPYVVKIPDIPRGLAMLTMSDFISDKINYSFPLNVGEGSNVVNAYSFQSVDFRGSIGSNNDLTGKATIPINIVGELYSPIPLTNISNTLTFENIQPLLDPCTKIISNEENVTSGAHPRSRMNRLSTKSKDISIMPKGKSTMKITDYSCNINNGDVIIENCMFNSIVDFDINNIKVISIERITDNHYILIASSLMEQTFNATVNHTESPTIQGKFTGSQITDCLIELSEQFTGGEIEVVENHTPQFTDMYFTDIQKDESSGVVKYICTLLNAINLQISQPGFIFNTTTSIDSLVNSDKSIRATFDTTTNSYNNYKVYEINQTVSVTLDLDMSQLRVIGELSDKKISGVGYGKYFTTTISDMQLSDAPFEQTKTMHQIEMIYSTENIGSKLIFSHKFYAKINNPPTNFGNNGILDVVSSSAVDVSPYYKIELDLTVSIPETEIVNQHYYNFYSNNVIKTINARNYVNEMILPVNLDDNTTSLDNGSPSLNNLNSSTEPVIYDFITNYYPNLKKLNYSWLYGKNYDFVDLYESNKSINLGNNITVQQYDLISASLLLQNDIQFSIPSVPVNAKIEDTNIQIIFTDITNVDVIICFADDVCFVKYLDGTMVESEYTYPSPIVGLALTVDIQSPYIIHDSNSMVQTFSKLMKLNCVIKKASYTELSDYENILNKKKQEMILAGSPISYPVPSSTLVGGNVIISNDPLSVGVISKFKHFMIPSEGSGYSKFDNILSPYINALVRTNESISEFNKIIQLLQDVKDSCLLFSNWILSPYLGPETDECKLNEVITPRNEIGYTIALLRNSTYPMMLYAPNALQQAGIIHISDEVKNNTISFTGDYFAIPNNDKIITIADNIQSTLMSDSISITANAYVLEAWISLS